MSNFLLNNLNGPVFPLYKLIFLIIFVTYFPQKTTCFITNSNSNIKVNNKDYGLLSLNYQNLNRRTFDTQFRLNSRTSIETVIHTANYKNYDPNCIKYRKAKYWREKSNEELEEEIRKIRKVLVKIEECIKVKDPTLLPDSKKNAKRTQAQLLFLLHERHLNSLRNSQKNTKDSNINK
ncbi:putative integral membrane protein [Theileria parva strain Muguga]|uniref:putative integral membrane protein n=1 Tax=Theileria parva strain Muguga TaxID=333668 RepID=UPI001C620E26|nr:putative integral membrane protein [Theileria parva strain Muguga]KAF5153386.1 putative integral membrane protein [Theileria parva strain Muguga]